MWWLFICLWGMMNSASLQTELYFTIFFVISVEQWQKPAVQQRGFGACSRWSSWVTLLYGKSTESSLFLFYLVEGQKYKWVFWLHWKTTLGQRRQRRSYSLSWAPGVCFVPLAALLTDERAVSPAPRRRCVGGAGGAREQQRAPNWFPLPELRLSPRNASEITAEMEILQWGRLKFVWYVFLILNI